MEDIDGGLHPAVDGQSLDEDEGQPFPYHGFVHLLIHSTLFWAIITIADNKRNTVFSGVLPEF